MSLLCIQVQLGRICGMDVSSFREAIVQALRANGISRHAEEEGCDDGPYINISFEAEPLAETWPRLRTEFYEDVRIGTTLQNGSIVVCQGQSGWDDYLLLHHFDPNIPLDNIGPS